jgi:hypothetical protein
MPSLWHQLLVRTCPLIVAIMLVLVPVYTAAQSRLPDGGTASYAGGGLRKAWYGDPTDRYDHAVLGDEIEGGALYAEGSDGKLLKHVLKPHQVFEDITPRLHDLNGDGTAEVVTILTSLDEGASLAVFGIKNSGLSLIANTRFIGLTHRWLNIAGLADYNGDGTTDVALVLTPHLGGALQFWTLEGSKLTLKGSLDGFSNHEIRTRALSMSATVDVNGDGQAEILVPAASRRSLRLVGFVDGILRDIKQFPLNGRISGDLQAVGSLKFKVRLVGGGMQTVSLN